MVNKIIIILSFRVGTSENKHIDHGVKETCAIMSTQVTYEIDYISLLWDSTIPNALSFCFLCILLGSKRKKIILKEIKIFKKGMFL